MRFPSLWLLVAVLSASGSTTAGPADRWVPAFCEAGGSGREADRGTAEAESSWNRAYREGLAALEAGDLYLAERDMCVALLAARRFDERDWRFAETLDELGLIAFRQADFDRAERVQGAAIAEMLLAVGPHGDPFHERPASDRAPIRADCRSGVAVYTKRLGWILERVAGGVTLSEIESRPWRIFSAGYVPLDAALAERLDWLISRYLLEENVAAADDLAALQRRIRDGR